MHTHMSTHTDQMTTTCIYCITNSETRAYSVPVLLQKYAGLLCPFNPVQLRKPFLHLTTWIMFSCVELCIRIIHSYVVVLAPDQRQCRWLIQSLMGCLFLILSLDYTGYYTGNEIPLSRLLLACWNMLTVHSYLEGIIHNRNNNYTFI